MTATKSGRTDSVLRRLLRRWQNRRAARADIQALANAGREAGNVARDVGLSTPELYTIARAGPESADQLNARLNALELDHVGAPTLRDLERVCAVCGAKRQCERDLARAPDDPVWQSYCPNAPTLQALEQSRRRGK